MIIVNYKPIRKRSLRFVVAIHVKIINILVNTTETVQLSRFLKGFGKVLVCNFATRPSSAKYFKP